MSMIRCDWCGDLADSDDQPEGFVLMGGKDLFVCERCLLNKEQSEADPADEARDDE